MSRNTASILFVSKCLFLVQLIFECVSYLRYCGRTCSGKQWSTLPLLPQAQSRGNPSLPTRDFIPPTAALPASVHFTHTTSTRCNISITVFSSTAYTAFCFHTIISLKCVFGFLFLKGHQCLYLFFHTLLTSWPSC